MLASIVTFSYNRLDHLTNLINSLKKNSLAKESELIIYYLNIRYYKNRHLVKVSTY